MGKEQDTRPKTCKIYYDDCGYDDDDICYLNVCVILYGYRDRVFWIYKYKDIVNSNKEINIT